MNETEFEELLHNWWNYYRNRQIRRTTRSLEGRYRPESDIESTPKAVIPIDIKNALLVERAIINPFPAKFRELIKFSMEHHSESEFWRFIRKNGFKAYNFNDEVRKAKIALRNRVNKN